jgi:hypothetical protein
MDCGVETVFSRSKDDGMDSRILKDEISKLEAEIGKTLAELNERLQQIQFKRELLRRTEEAEAQTKPDAINSAMS